MACSCELRKSQRIRWNNNINYCRNIQHKHNHSELYSYMYVTYNSGYRNKTTVTTFPPLSKKKRKNKMCRVYEFPHCTLKPWCIFLIRKPENIFVIRVYAIIFSEEWPLTAAVVTSQSWKKWCFVYAKNQDWLLLLVSRQSFIFVCVCEAFQLKTNHSLQNN